IHVGEGVFGLRRAFVLAGAKTLIMSLWKVPDEPTRELMENFYRRLLVGQGRAEALREAQLVMKAKYPDPFYWGAFICQDDPGPPDSASAPQRGSDAEAAGHRGGVRPGPSPRQSSARPWPWSRRSSKKGTAQIPAKIYAQGFWAVSLALKVVFPNLRLRKK